MQLFCKTVSVFPWMQELVCKTAVCSDIHLLYSCEAFYNQYVAFFCNEWMVWSGFWKVVLQRTSVMSVQKAGHKITAVDEAVFVLISVQHERIHVRKE